MVNLYNQFIVIAKLLGALAEACRHFKVQITNSVIICYQFIVFVLKANAIRHASCSLYYLVDHVIPNRTLLKTYYVHHTVRLYCVFACQLFEHHLRFL